MWGTRFGRMLCSRVPAFLRTVFILLYHLVAQVLQIMMMHNQHLAPGTYKHTGSGNVVVVTNVITHSYTDGDMKPITPMVVYRDLITTGIDHTAYLMDLETFKTKFDHL